MEDTVARTEADTDSAHTLEAAGSGHTQEAELARNREEDSGRIPAAELCPYPGGGFWPYPGGGAFWP